MWIKLQDSFLNVVMDSGNQSNVLVLAPTPWDLTSLFPQFTPERIPGVDRVYFVSVPRPILSHVIVEHVSELSDTITHDLAWMNTCFLLEHDRRH